MKPQEAKKKAQALAREENIRPMWKPRICDCVYCTTGPRRPMDLLVNYKDFLIG